MLTKRSLDLLRPTIRADGSEIWATWNPTRKSDAIKRAWQTLRGQVGGKHAALRPALGFLPCAFSLGQARSGIIYSLAGETFGPSRDLILS